MKQMFVEIKLVTEAAGVYLNRRSVSKHNFFYEEHRSLNKQFLKVKHIFDEETDKDHHSKYRLWNK